MRMPSRFRYIVIKCPICGKEKKERYTINKETSYRIRTLRYGVWAEEAQGSSMYFFIPCDEHEEEFIQHVKEYLAKFRKATTAFRRSIHREITKVTSKIIDEALKELNEKVKALKPGEGLVFWVCEAGHEECETVREVFAMVIKEEDGSIKKITGSLEKPLVVYKKGDAYALTHYTSQDANFFMSQHKVAWKGFIQGLWIENEKDLRYIIDAIFFWTHGSPTYTLVDFLRRQYGSLYNEFAEVIAKYKGNADPRFWTIVEKESLEQKVREKIIKKYGIDPTKQPHVKDILSLVKNFLSFEGYTYNWRLGV